MTATTQRPAHLTYDQFPEHARLSARVAELQSRLNATRARLRSAMRREQQTPAAVTARRLIDADVVPDRLADAPVLEQSEAARLTREQRILDEAVKMASDQLRALESKLSFDCHTPELREWHRGLVAELARRMVEVVLLARVEEAAFDALRDDGVEPRLCPHGGPARPMFLGSLRSRLGDAGNVRVWLDNLVEQGLLTGEEPWLVEFVTSEPELSPVGRTTTEAPRPAGTLAESLHKQLMKKFKSWTR